MTWRVYYALSAYFPRSVLCICIVLIVKTQLQLSIPSLSQSMQLSEDQHCWKQDQEAAVLSFIFTPRLSSLCM